MQCSCLMIMIMTTYSFTNFLTPHFANWISTDQNNNLHWPWHRFTHFVSHITFIFQTTLCHCILRGYNHFHFWAGTVRDWPRPYLLVLSCNSRAKELLVPGVPGRRQNFFGNKNLKNVWLENWIRVFGVKLLNCIDPKDWWVEKSKKLNATFWMCVSS